MRRWVTTILGLALGACGTSGAAPAEGGAPDASAGPRSFDVVATLRTRGDGGVVDAASTTNRFTLALDRAAARAVGGGGGEARAVPLATVDGRTFEIASTIGVGVSHEPCTGLVRVAYETMELTIAAGTLTGRATGSLFFASDVSPRPFEATLEGVPDTTPPTFVLPAGSADGDPLTPFHVWASEPLPASALARLVSAAGSVVGLVPEVVDGDVPLVASFAKAGATLPLGQSFEALYSDDVTDLAGNVAPLGVGLPVFTLGAAPLVPPDGFESATGDTQGGGRIVRNGAGILIAGAASVYVGAHNSPAPLPVQAEPKLVVRLAVPPGATKLAFSYRVIAGANLGGEPPGTVQLGSLGRPPGDVTPIPAPASFAPVAWESSTVDASPVATMNVPLPEAFGAEVIVVVTARTACEAASPGLLLDDLRLE